jgi:hypothetical protein
MESRRLVVWISAGILGFQGATLAFDLLNCTVLSWLFVRQHGMGMVVQQEPPQAVGLAPPGAGTGPPGDEAPEASGGSSGGERQPSSGDGSPEALQPAPRSRQPEPSTLSAFDPTGVFCAQPRSRIDDAVSQGLTILAGLALGSSVGGGAGRGQP